MTSNPASTNPDGFRENNVVLQGYHKKLKTMKKKYFVLCAEDENNSAHLEYYDNEKKFKSRSNPKRTIILKNCFNINRRRDTKHTYVIALSTKEEEFCIVFENEQELSTWLKSLLALQRGEDTESDPPKPNFEHVWQVQVQRKGLAEEKGIIGKYYVCLTSKALTLVRIGSPKTTSFENRLGSVEFYLTTIRRCGDSQCFFYMEVGRHSAIGAGELWMQTESPLIAQNMHKMIISAMSSTKNMEDGFGPMRKRSSSANEASKPISVIQRRQTHSGTKPMNSSPLSGTTLGRERCDSLPSRNRTTSECSNQSMTQTSMPPPKSAPMPNRPMSMYTHRHSNSPPMSTLSPSTGCSESDGSSLSIDEPDSFGHSLTPDESGNFVANYFNSRSGVIPEENDFWGVDSKNNSMMLDNLNNHHGGLSLPIATNYNAIRKGSPASHIGSGDMQSQYMDMFSPHSPYGSSPCEPPGTGFTPVSPGIEYHRGLYTGSSGGHSRASSLIEETVDVPMGPPPSTDYVDMEQSSKQLSMSGLSSAASSSSITSGTPSTDLRFAEYTLDKVKTRFTPDDEDLHSLNERPIRAYSVGSRPEHNKRKFRMEILNAEPNNSRARACSVGSRAKVPRSDLYRGVFAPSLTHCIMNNNNNVEAIIASNKGKKSSSAPLLVHKSQSSVDRMSDLMEIDFSKNNEHYDRSSHSKPSPVRISSFPVSVPIAKQRHDFFENSPKLSRFEMKPSSFTDKSSPSMRQTSSDSGYLEMRPIGATKNCSLSSSPIKFNSAPKPITRENDVNNYMNISPSTSSTSAIHHRRVNSDDYLNMSPRDKVITSDKKMNIDSFLSNSSTPEGYIEMSFKKPSRRDNNDANIPNDTGNKSGEPKITNHDTRTVSSPIDIKTTKDKRLRMHLGSFMKVLPFVHDERKDKTFTEKRPNINSDNLFSFSPVSPVDQFIQNDFTQRKCLVDATSGTVTISNDNSNINPVLTTIAGNRLNVDTTKILNTDDLANKKSIENVEALSNDYADMSLGSSKLNSVSNKKEEIIEASDYVNYVPTTSDKPASISPVISKPKSDGDGDYAIMSQKARNIPRPVVNSSSNTNNISNSGDTLSTETTLNNNKKHVLVVDKNNENNRASEIGGFKPIASVTDETFLRRMNCTRKITSPKSGVLCLSRQLSEKCKNDNSSGYELLQMRSDSSLQTKKILSRPNSVNSEKISPSKYLNRPNSANSECMPSISTSSSTSTLCGSSSSSSTLCGSKSQSPLANSRPQSFSDTTVSSRPESVSSIADQIISSRPPSVSSERGLHYASLDLPPSNISNNNNSTLVVTGTKDNDNGIGGSGSGCTTPSLIKCGNSSASGESSSPSPNASGCQQQQTFIYAQIDFNKSESLKMAINAGNNK